MADDADVRASLQALREVGPRVGQLLERHLAMTEDWLPYPPADLAVLGPTTLDEGTRSALLVNLLTEDNLPYYARDGETFVVQLGPAGEVYDEWLRRWVAEEARHAIAIRGYVVATEAVDLGVLEASRMASMQAGWRATFGNPLEAPIYTAVQELATRIAHRNTFVRLPEGPARDVLLQVVGDENLHHLFYRDLCAAVAEVDPSAFVIALERQLTGFDMPGTGIPGFRGLARAIAAAGIYDMRMFVDQVALPLVERHWRVPALVGLSERAEHARDRLLDRLERLGRMARRMTERLQPAAAQEAR